MNRLYILFLVVMWTGGVTTAQSLKQYKAEAAKAIEAKDFARSLEFYNKIINQADDKNADNYYQAAESARQFRIYSLAEEYYKEVLKDSIGHNRYRLTNYHLGTVLKSQARYNEAIQSFKKFIERDAAFATEEFTEKAEKEIIDCEWAKSVVDDETVIQHLDSTVNTPNSEFGPFEYEDTLYYSSVRYLTSDKYDPIPPLSRIYNADLVHDGTQVSEDFNKVENLHSGNVTFNVEGTRMYYTICKNVNVSDMHCKIYYRDKNGSAWGDIDSLSNLINSEEYTATQPSVGFDYESGKEILFFATDRPTDTTDTKKDLNIWCSYMDENGKWGPPAYVSEVNTNEDEVTPFFHTSTQTLYFSSNGLRNLGGFDIYSIQKNGNDWGKIKGLGSPTNTSYDEMYYTINDEGSFAYMSSNRPGGSCDPLDSLCVCNDIYRMPQIFLQVRTFNKLSGDSLIGTEVVLNEANMNTPKRQSRLDGYIYNFYVGFDKSYSFEGTKVDTIETADGIKIANWLPDMKDFDTFKAKGGDTIVVDLFLTPPVDVNVFTFNKITGEALPGCKVEIFLVDENGENEYSPSQEEFNSSRYNFGLEFKKKFKIVATKDGYSTDESYRTVTDNIKFEPTTLADELFLCKLPPPPDSIRLYFANDEPGPHTRRDTVSETDYGQLHGSYKGIKSLFYQNNTQGNRGLVDKFFNKIDRGQKRLENFTSDISTYLKLLNEGETLTVEVRGFASPLGPQDEGSYNFALSKRRIDSIRKYFENNLPADEFAKLRVVAVPNGDTLSPKSVPRSGLQAIFGIDSSEERRVEIIAIRLSKGTCIDWENIPTEPIPTDVD